MNRISAVLAAMIMSLVSYSQDFKYPSIATTGTSMYSFIPKDWRILNSAKGDLNKDGKDDLAFILQHIDSIQFVKKDSEYSDTVVTQPRILCIVFQQKDGIYNLIEQSNSFILNHDSPQMDDPYESIMILNGVLQINFRLFYNMGSWYVNQLSYKFRYHNENFELIGADNNSLHRASLETEDRSYNFLTNKYSVTTGNADGSVESKTNWHTLMLKDLKNLKIFQQPLTWEVTESHFL